MAEWVRVASGFGRGKELAKGKTAVVTMRARARGKVALSLFGFCILLERLIESRVLKDPNLKYYVTKDVWERSFRV